MRAAMPSCQQRCVRLLLRRDMRYAAPARVPITRERAARCAVRVTRAMPQEREQRAQRFT